MQLKKATYCLFFSIAMLCYPDLNAHGYTDTLIIKKVKTETLKEKIYNSPLVLKTSPTAFIFGGVFPFTAEYRLMAEITTSRKQSEQIAISILGKSMVLLAVEKMANMPNAFKVSGWRIQYAHKFYLVNRRHHAPFGFYVAPLFSYANAHIALGLNRYYRQTYFDFRHMNANIIIGVQVGKMNKVTMDLYAGGGYKTNKVYYHYMNNNIIPLKDSDIGISDNSHINVVFGINLGYSF